MAYRGGRPKGSEQKAPKLEIDPRTTLGYDEATPRRQLQTAQTIERAIPAPAKE